MCAPLFLEDETGRLMLHPAGSELRVDGYFADEHSEETVGFFIKPGDTVFVFGTLQENRSARTAAGASELSPIGPGFVSKDAAELTWPEGFAPVRYAVESGPQALGEFDLRPQSILMKGKDPFVVSHQSQRAVLSKLSWQSLLCIWGGPAATLAGLWELLFNGPGLLRYLMN